MFISIFFLLWMTYSELGGVTAAHEALSNAANLIPESLQAKGHQGWTSFPQMGSAWWWVLTTNILLGVGIGVLAQPQLVVRFMTVKSNRELNRAVLIGAIFIFVTTGFIYTVGALSNIYFLKEKGELAIQVASGNIDLIIPEYIQLAMPEWFVYIFMLALLSAGMSTLSSQFHTMGSSIGRDVFENLFPKKQMDSTFVTRVGIVVAILVSVIIGYNLPISIVARGTAIFFGICAATFLPTYFAALYWKGATKTGVIWSMVTGLLSSAFALAFLHQKEAEPLGICKALFGQDVLINKFPWMIVDPIMIALPLAIIVLIGVSLFTRSQTVETI